MRLILQSTGSAASPSRSTGSIAAKICVAAALIAWLVASGRLQLEPDRVAEVHLPRALGRDAHHHLGGLADLRLGLRLGRARLWSNARMVRLVHDEAVKVESKSPGVADSIGLAPWDLQLGLGLGLRFE